MKNRLNFRRNLNSIHSVIGLLFGVFLIGWSVTSFTNVWWIAVLSAIGSIQIIGGIVGY